MSDNVQESLNKLKLHPRICHLIKWKDFNGYGFNLHAEKGKAGQFIGKVDDGSPAEAAFLKQGDRIIEVNGVNIGNENHQQVVQRIKAGGEETKLLVVDTETDIHFKSQKIVVREEMPEIAYCKTPEIRGFATPIISDNQSSETNQNAETGETTSQGSASAAAGTSLITNGLTEDLPAPPPELIENGHEPTVEKMTVSEVESEVHSNIESDAIYDIPDTVPVITTNESWENIGSGSVKSASEKSESDNQETNSIKSEKAESEKAESVKSESLKAETGSENGEVDIMSSVKSDVESIQAEAISNHENFGSARATSSVLTKIPLDDLETPPSLPQSLKEVTPSLPESIKKPKDIDINDPLNFVNVSVEEMRQKILSKKKIKKFQDMNLKEKHDILDRL